MPLAEFDHIVIAARDLKSGLAHVGRALGVMVPQGGVHPTMGTHNCLMRIGPAAFLEVIAPNPEAPAPARPRWFGLDTPPAEPRLAHWVIRTADMAALHPDLPPASGPAIEATRGELRWQITVPDDGALPYGGAFPTLIQWAPGTLPPRQMPDLGCTLTRLQIRHPEGAGIAGRLKPWLADPRIEIGTGALSLVAEIATPNGVRRLT
ncbi:VOC family protein [Pseudooceanicola nanhaiensis]|uniref:VOC family protein n=1 Tax=Pseudooceanicola nanhaiensis TaxID=375761 RepID=UPI001CD3BD53|nr:VOC family protein [Pseudooceanicola nanhaiensis]MCA0918831.1 VOC family protein [Pseudooceanicola nanhaiensis]